MKHAIAIAGLVLVTTAGSSAVAMTGPSAGRTVTVFEDGRDGTYAFFDHPPKSPVHNPNSPRARFSLGDEAAFTTNLLDRAGGMSVGRVYATESVMSGSRFPHVTVMVHAVFWLHRGKLVVDAVVNETHPERVRGAVTGGTGAFEGARGTFTTVPGRIGNIDTFSLVD
jgi:hypothetical protein